jgi:hypothetical protein
MKSLLEFDSRSHSLQYKILKQLDNHSSSKIFVDCARKLIDSVNANNNSKDASTRSNTL